VSSLSPATSWQRAVGGRLWAEVTLKLTPPITTSEAVCMGVSHPLLYPLVIYIPANHVAGGSWRCVLVENTLPFAFKHSFIACPLIPALRETG